MSHELTSHEIPNPNPTMSTRPKFKATPFNLTQEECDDLDHQLRNRAMRELAGGNNAAWEAFRAAAEMLSTARDLSFKARSAARRERLEKRLGPGRQLTPA